MTALLLLAWTAAALGAAALTWRRMERHAKVYLLIFYSGVWLTGAFLLLAALERS